MLHRHTMRQVGKHLYYQFTFEWHDRLLFITCLLTFSSANKLHLPVLPRELLLFNTSLDYPTLKNVQAKNLLPTSQQLIITS
jgi:hypothetical protein